MSHLSCSIEIFDEKSWLMSVNDWKSVKSMVITISYAWTSSLFPLIFECENIKSFRNEHNHQSKSPTDDIINRSSRQTTSSSLIKFLSLSLTKFALSIYNSSLIEKEFFNPEPVHQVSCSSSPHTFEQFDHRSFKHKDSRKDILSINLIAYSLTWWKSRFESTIDWSLFIEEHRRRILHILFQLSSPSYRASFFFFVLLWSLLENNSLIIFTSIKLNDDEYVKPLKFISIIVFSKIS